MKCTTIKHCDVAKAPCPGRPRDEHEIATAANHSLISAGAHTHRENYTMYKYVLNLPGSTSGSYSRNLNHLWSLDSVVLLDSMVRRRDAGAVAAASFSESVEEAHVSVA